MHGQGSAEVAALSAGPRLRRSASLARAGLEGALVAAVACLLIGWNTRLEAPPRFDGAGYAVLAEGLATGQGYREIDRPDQPPHAHYPPGYPLVLSVLWRITGWSAPAAHMFSLVCTVGAVIAGWLCFRRLYRPGVALVLGLALACNWAWGRAGGEIQSEPLFLLLEMLTLFLALRPQTPDGVASGLGLGAMLGCSILTRHVGVALAVAVLLDLWLRKRPQKTLAAAMMVLVLILPWILWVAMVRQNTQVALLARGGLAIRILDNAIFYLRRIPDQVTGPFVEVATVFGRSGWVAGLATAWAIFATGLVAYGWFLCLGSPRRRLLGMVPLFTLGLLLVWPFTEAGRFLIPLLPFVLTGGMTGLARISPFSARSFEASQSDPRRQEDRDLTLRSPMGAAPPGPTRWRRGLAERRKWARARGLRRHARLTSALVILLTSLPYTVYSVLTDRAGVRQRAHADFDAACAWIVKNGSRPGSILTRQPGEVYWLTGRTAVLPAGEDLDEIERTIDRYRVAYILVDQERYARAPENPLARFVEHRPERVRQVWSVMTKQVVSEPGGARTAAWPRMAVYAVSPEHPVSGLGPRR